MYALSKNIKNIKKFSMKFSIFTTEKNICILHGQVFIFINQGEGETKSSSLKIGGCDKNEIHQHFLILLQNISFLLV